MNQNDPFSAFGAERTIIKPRLGKTDPFSPPPEKASPSFETDAHNEAFDTIYGKLSQAANTSENPFITEATPLLRMICSVRQLPYLNNQNMLATVLKQGLTNAERSLSKQQIESKHILAFRYIVSTFVDEYAANTPWGGSGSWASHSLLLANFSETWGGEKVFLLLNKLMESPPENKALLGLIYLMLLLGFKGKYHIAQNGEQQLQTLKLKLAGLLGEKPIDETSPLALSWRSKAPKTVGNWRFIPLWLPVTLACLVCASTFVAFYFAINTKSDKSFNHITSLTFAAPKLPARVETQNTLEYTPTLRELLSQEIEKGLIKITQSGNKSILTLVGDGMFESGSGTMPSAAEDLVNTVAAAVAQVPGSLKVVGHTDSTPIRSVQFPSNWHLSTERARVVGQLLAEKLPSLSISTEGAGASHPIADNKTPEGRSLNRRVEITITHDTPQS